MVLNFETLGKVDHKYAVSFEMWYCRCLEKISWIGVWEKKCYVESRSRGISYIHYNEEGKLGRSHLTWEQLSETRY